MEYMKILLINYHDFELRFYVELPTYLPHGLITDYLWLVIPRGRVGGVLGRC